MREPERMKMGVAPASTTTASPGSERGYATSASSKPTYTALTTRTSTIGSATAATSAPARTGCRRSAGQATASTGGYWMSGVFVRLKVVRARFGLPAAKTIFILPLSVASLSFAFTDQLWIDALHGVVPESETFSSFFFVTDVTAASPHAAFCAVKSSPASVYSTPLVSVREPPAAPQLKSPVMLQSIATESAPGSVTVADIGPSTLNVRFFHVPDQVPAYFVGSKAPAGVASAIPTIIIPTTKRSRMALR
jgi:hypothetical protein